MARPEILMRLFLAYNSFQSAEQLAVYADVCKSISAEDLRRGVERLIREPNRTKLPTAAQLRQTCIASRPGHQQRREREPANRGDKNDMRRVVEGLMNFGEDERTDFCDECGAEFVHFVGYFRRLEQLRERGEDAPQLCMDCARRRLVEVGRQKRKQADWAWPVLVRIAKEVAPQPWEVAQLDHFGFRAERISRMARAGLLSNRKDTQ